MTNLNPSMDYSAKEKTFLTPTLLKSFRFAKEITSSNNYRTEEVSAIDFTSDGENLVAALNNGEIRLYTSADGDLLKTITVRKYGVDLVRCASDPSEIIHTATRGDFRLCLLKILKDSVSYIQYLKGHTEPVVSMAMSPQSAMFISTSLDRTLRLWDTRSGNCNGMMTTATRPLAALDPTGKVFAVGVNSQCVKLYDVRSFSHGPFKTIDVTPVDEKCDWNELKFSTDGKVIMINTNGSMIRLIDAFKGNELRSLTDRPNLNRTKHEASFSPDSQFILSGSADGVHIWNADTGIKVCVLDRGTPDSTRHVLFNPNYALLATADKTVNYWLPTI